MSRGRHAKAGSHPFRRVLVGLAAVVVLVVSVLAIVVRQGIGSKAQPRTGKPPPSAYAGAPSRPPAGSGPATSSSRPAPAPSPSWMTFATVGSLQLVTPTIKEEAIAFHQAYYEDALAMQPVGHLKLNANKKNFTNPPPEQPGPAYMVQADRGRKTGPTTAVDVVAPPATAIYSPVDGKVVQVRRYKLYGQYPDTIVRIDPIGQPDLQVVMIHLTAVQVHEGDEVHARLSVIGKPREFPFHSEINDYVRGGDPHVHIEVKDRNSPHTTPAS